MSYYAAPLELPEERIHRRGSPNVQPSASALAGTAIAPIRLTCESIGPLEILHDAVSQGTKLCDPERPELSRSRHASCKLARMAILLRPETTRTDYAHARRARIDPRHVDAVQTAFRRAI